MNVWLVIPAWRRYAVTTLALAQHAHLRGELAARGVTCRSVVVADDDNLDIARRFGCDTVTQTNDTLGRKVNDGFQYACEHAADYVAFIGSDDWLHIDAFEPLLADRPSSPPVVAGHHIAIVDLMAAKLQRLGVRGPTGVSPWLIPRWALEPSGFRPAEDHKAAGMEGSIFRGIGSGPDWVFHDPHPLTRVDFKSDIGMTAYDSVAKMLGYGGELAPPWELLATKYPADLVDLAERTHRILQPAEAVAA